MKDPGVAHAPGCPGKSTGTAPLNKLAELVIERLALGHDVAAVKYVNGRPIDDPIREHQILELATQVLNGSGRYQQIGRQFFSDQLEANKVIQRQLHHRWRAHPEEVPVAHRNLAAEIRPDLDDVTAQMMREFMKMEELPHVRCGYIEDLIDTKLFTKFPPPQLQEVHRDAAVFALRSFVTS